MSELPVLVEGLVVRYGSKTAVAGVTFSVKPGEVYGLLGPNGAGKSSVIKVLVGLVQPASGRVRIFGRSPSDSEAKMRIGYVPEEVVLFDSLTPREYLEFVASVRRMDSATASERFRKLAEAFGLSDYVDTPIGALSKGNRQKVALVAALIHEPPLLILDEPFTGLDVASSKVLKEILAAHVRRGGAVLMSTHVMELAEKLCTRVGIMSGGRIVSEGSVSELRELVGAAGLEEVFLKVTGQEAWVSEVVKALEE
jgi:ABC-2 type transport system ATP-binding protein